MRNSNFSFALAKVSIFSNSFSAVCKMVMDSCFFHAASFVGSCSFLAGTRLVALKSCAVAFCSIKSLPSEAEINCESSFSASFICLFSLRVARI